METDWMEFKLDSNWMEITINKIRNHDLSSEKLHFKSIMLICEDKQGQFMAGFFADTHKTYKQQK